MPITAQAKKSTLAHAQQLSYLEQHPYEKFSDEEIAHSKKLLQKEIEVVKNGMGHGELSLEAYTQVWEECLAQVNKLYRVFNDHTNFL